MMSSPNQAAASTGNSYFHQLPSPDRSVNEELWRCLPLYRALLRGDQHGFEQTARSLGLPLEEALSKKITGAGDTGLHVLVGAGKWFYLTVPGMITSVLTLRNRDGHTPLCLAASVGNMKAAKDLLELERELPLNERTLNEAVIEAARYGHKEMKGCPLPAKQSTVSLFLHLLVVAGFYDLLLVLIRRRPGLARAEFYGDNNESLLSLMAGKPLAFQIIHANLGIRLADIEKPLFGVQHLLLPPRPSPQPADGLTWERFLECSRDCITAILAWLARVIYSCVNHVVTPIRHIRDTKLMHEEALDIVKCLCKELMKHDSSIEPVLQMALLSAARSGTSEIIEEIIECYPDAIWFVDSENHNLFHLAVINRYEKVFNLIYQLSAYKHLVTANEDTSGNNILHMAGKLAPLGRLNLISGAALQMQRELQWFQEVEKFVHPTFRTKRNSYGKTPKMVFTEEHKELVKEGEKWMKETANSCIFVAALTATVGFAAAITVPGGNNQNSGFPLFSNETAFTFFAVSVAFCLFSSVASVLMFLSMLTSRYAEDDFLKSLPKRLILGLGTLFVSMTSLMIAFGATIYLIFGQKKEWIHIPIGIAALIPVFLFESLQFPLLLDMFMSTYGPSIFRKQGSRLLY